MKAILSFAKRLSPVILRSRPALRDEEADTHAMTRAACGVRRQAKRDAAIPSTRKRGRASLAAALHRINPTRGFPFAGFTLLSLGFWILLTSGLALTCAAAPVTWQRTDESVACKSGDEILWQFNYGIRAQKPYFHPLRVAGGEALTTSRPTDHRWHYGLWFSWKYINGVNYWEEDKSGHSQGKTTWTPPAIKTHEDGSAEISMTLRYVSPTNGLIMKEEREIQISAPNKQGEVTIDWLGKFEAVNEPLVLDRTPMPGEPNGAVNGGYAGFAFRAAQDPAQCQFVTAEGPVEKFESDRARPNSKAAACNIMQGGHTNGVAIFSHVSNTGGDSPWYIINSKTMRWFSPSLLAPAPKTVKPRETFTWKFRVMTKAGEWTDNDLKKESEAYNH